MDSIGERRRHVGQAGWVCAARVNGVNYEVWLIAIDNGTSKPDTWGTVPKTIVKHEGPVVWEARVPATISPREILRLAGLIEEA